MTYNHLMNAECLYGFKRYKWACLGRTMASQDSVTIQFQSRQLTWGQNYYGQSGQGDPCWLGGNYTNSAKHNIEYATQLTHFSDFIKSCSGEIGSVALRENGELWG